MYIAPDFEMSLNKFEIIGSISSNIAIVPKNVHTSNCFRLLNGKKPIKQVSIPYVIEVMLTQYILNELNPSYQDNGRSIYEQTFHSLLRTSKSKKGLKLKGEKTDEE